MTPEVIAGIIGAVAVVLSTSISYIISLKIGRKQTRLGYLQTVLSDETMLRNFRFFWRQLNTLRIYYRLLSSKTNSVSDLNNENVKDDFDLVFAYLKDRLGYKKRKLEKHGRRLRPFEEQVLKLTKEEADKEYLAKILQDQNFLDSLELCLEDAHRHFHARPGEAWFCVLFGPAPKLHRQIAYMTRSSITWKNDLAKWDRISQLLGRFVAGDW